MEKQRTITTRIGRLVISLDKTIRFPRGLIGFEDLREFALVVYKPGTPFHFLQSMESSGMGMLLADPFPFLPDYALKLGAADEKLLKMRSIRDLITLVTVSVPKGKPEDTTLNLVGPICINVHERVGAQIPQVESGFPSKMFLRELGDPQPRSANS